MIPMDQANSKSKIEGYMYMYNENNHIHHIIHFF